MVNTRGITDVGVLEPDPRSCELTLAALHPGVEEDDVRAETQWDLRVSDDLGRTEPPTAEELSALRELVSR
jgi:glutaconate CoA-transferase, subunit B